MDEVLQSPFKFLDAFEKSDHNLFYGREDEIETLYEMTYDTRLIVFFGASGTGKTSMIQCGLANKFEETRWQELYIRRGENIMESLLTSISDLLQPFDENLRLSDPIEGLNLLYKYTFKPIFITFDQFEELFILKPDKEEQIALFKFIQRYLDTPLSSKAILVMREEFIAYLWDYEYLVPNIFDYRFRISELKRNQMVWVIEKMLGQLVKEEEIQANDPNQLAECIVKQLENSNTDTGLTYLQVYLDTLYREAYKKDHTLPVISVALIQDLGNFDDVIDDFLDKQLLGIEQKLGDHRKGIPLRILGAMVSSEQTKKVMQLDDLEEIRQKFNLSEEEMDICLHTFESMRIIKRYES